MRFGLLGPLSVTSDAGEPVEVRGRKLRVLVAMLLCRANQPVATLAIFTELGVREAEGVRGRLVALSSTNGTTTNS